MPKGKPVTQQEAADLLNVSKRRDDPVRRATENQFVFVFDWFEELKQRVPTGR